MVSLQKYGKRTKRRSRYKTKKKTKKHSIKKVTFITADGKRVSFTPKKRKRGPTPRHLKAHTNKMKELGARYRDGEFGNMKWRSVVKKYMSKSKRKSRRRSRR